MKKLVLFTVIAVFAFVSVNAQMEVRFGVKAGANLATIGGDFGISDFDEETDTKSQFGFHVGGLVELKLSEKFALQPELLYSQQGAKIEFSSISFPEDNFEQKTTLSYIHVPIMAKFFPIENFSIQLGPQVGFLISDKDDFTNNSTPDPGDEPKYKSFDFGINFGLGYRLENGVNFSARYNFGLTKIDDVPDEFNFGLLGDTFSRKNRVLQISVGYMF